MDNQPVAGTSGLQNRNQNSSTTARRLEFEEDLANETAISQILQQDLDEIEANKLRERMAAIPGSRPGLQVPLDPDDQEPEEYDVEDIRAKRKNAKTGMLEYLVKWANYPESQNTWEPIDNLKCPELIARFNEAEKNKRKRRNTGDSQVSTPAQQPKRVRTKFTPNQSMVAGDAVINAAAAGQVQQQSSTSPAKPSTSQVKSTPSQVKSTPSQVKPTPSQVKPTPSQVKPTTIASTLANEQQQSQRKQTRQQPANEPLLLEDFEQDAASTETLSSTGSSSAKDKNGADYVDDQARNFLAKGFDRRLPIERIVGSCMDDENKLWFFVKWKDVTELELIDYKDLLEKAPRDLCVWYTERLFYAVENHGTTQGLKNNGTEKLTTNSRTTATNVSS